MNTKIKSMIYKFTSDYRNRMMKRGCVLEIGHLHFNDKPENAANLMLYETED